MPGAEVGESRGDAGYQFHPVLDQGHGQRVDLAPLGLGRRPLLQPGEALTQAAHEDLAAVPMGDGVGRLDVIEHRADRSRVESRMRQPVHEVVDHPLEEHVVLPQRVIRVEDERLSGGPRQSWGSLS